MHYIKLLYIISLFFLLPVILTPQVVEICGSAGMDVMDGEYHISNNIWGSGTGVGDQCLEVDENSTYFKVSLSTHNSSEVASYPFIYKGYHFGPGNHTAPEYNPFPIQVNELGSAPFTWVINTEEVEGIWNAAFEAWFSIDGASNPTGGAELMIWLDYVGGAVPAGSVVDNVDIGGINWDVRFAAWDIWNYIAFQATTPVDSVTLDLKDFVLDALDRGYLFTTLYLDNMEAGFEIWRDGQGLTSLYYSADAETGDPLENYPPTSFRLNRPINNKTVDALVVEFIWIESIDVDLDPVEYILYISGPGLDTTITGINTTNYSFDGGNYLQLDTSYTWYVRATDGTDTTMSTELRTFRTPKSVGIFVSNKIPDGFFLNQNYPNPFNPDTEIEFGINIAGQIELSIFDNLGRKIKTLSNGFFSPGKYKAIFNASDLSTGIYYYQLKTSYQTLLRKCIYVK